MKKLYAFNNPNPDNEYTGTLLCYDPASETWSNKAVGGGGATFSPTQGMLATAQGLFVYRGQLFARTRERSGSQEYINVYRYNTATDVFEQVVSGLLGSPNHDYGGQDGRAWGWGPVINYGGRIYWLGSDASNTLQLYSFWATSPSSYSIKPTEVQGAILTSDPLIYGDAVDSMPSCTSPNLIALDDRLFITTCGGGSIAPLGDGNGLYLWGLQSKLHLEGQDTLTATRVDTLDTHRFFTTPVPDGVMSMESMNAIPVAACEWKGKLFYATVHAKVMAYDPVANTTTEQLDFHSGTSSCAALQFGSTYTATMERGRPSVPPDLDEDGNPLPWDEVPGDPGDPGGDPPEMPSTLVHLSAETRRPWNRFGLGASFFIDNYNDLGTTKRGICYRKGAPDLLDGQYISLMDASNGSVLDNQRGWATDTRSFTGAWGFGPSWDNSRSRQLFMFVYNAKLYILATSVLLTGDGVDHSPETPPWTLHVWDGAGSPTHYAYTRGTNYYYTMANIRFVLDSEAGIVHLIGGQSRFDIAGRVDHYTLDLASPSSAPAFKGTINVSGGAPIGLAGAPIDSIVAWDPGDVTAVIDSTVVDIDHKKTTINYTLCAINDVTCSVEVEYAWSGGWFTAARKGTEGEGKTGLAATAAGTQHTFVHDFSALNTTTRAKTQYRIRIVSQTR